MHQLCDVCPSEYNLGKPILRKFVKHLTCGRMGEMENACKILVGKHEGKIPVADIGADRRKH
jgi:hypothetical protein